VEDLRDGVYLIVIKTDISNLFDALPEEILEVKYLNHYQAMFGGTPGTVHLTKEGLEFVHFNHGSKAFKRVKISPAHAHMVIPIEKRVDVPPQKPAPQSILGQPIQTSPLQKATPLQPVITPAHTITHVRSSPQQPINQEMTRRPIT
jgi:hypothetical protein